MPKEDWPKAGAGVVVMVGTLAAAAVAKGEGLDVTEPKADGRGWPKDDCPNAGCAGC